MAIYYASLRTISRAKGGSAVSAAAYRAGIVLTDERTGESHDYRRRRGVDDMQCFAPSDAPAWATDIGVLWNRAEAAEARRDARTARELIVALPHQLNERQRRALAAAVSDAIVTRYAVAVTCAVHAPDARGDDRNWHAHLLFTTRKVGPAGMGAKVRCLDDRVQGPKEVEALRVLVADHTNHALTMAGFEERIDHRSLGVQSLDAEAAGEFERAARLIREPTRHVGRAELAKARRGEYSQRVAVNQAIVADNERALATYLASAKGEGRLVTKPVLFQPMTSATALSFRPANRLARVHGNDAKLINAQAKIVEAQQRAATESQRDYLEGIQRVRAELEKAMSTNAALSIYSTTASADSPTAFALRQALETAQRRLDEVRALRAARQQTFLLARKRREEEQAAQIEADKQRAPHPWRVRQRQQWEGMRRARGARLRQAIEAEQQARSAVSKKARAELAQRAAALRTEAQRLQEQLARLDMEHHPAHHSSPRTPGPSRPSLH